MFQFELLVMTEKNIFAYKLFLSLNMFYVKIVTPPPGSPPSFPATPLYKLTSCQNPPF